MKNTNLNWQIFNVIRVYSRVYIEKCEIATIIRYDFFAQLHSK